MKTNYNKYEKLNSISKEILSNKPYHSSIIQKKFISSNSKKIENNNSLLLKKNLKQNKMNINKKLDLIKETNENMKIYKYSENQRNTYNRQLISGNSKSYIMEESTKTSNIKVPKNEYNKSLLLKKYALQTDKSIPEKQLSNNNHFRQSKSTSKDISLSFYPKKSKQKLISNNLNNNLKKVKSKLNNRLNIKKSYIESPTPEDVFIFDENRPIILTKDEQVIYGDRTMKGYNKRKLLGKGGYGIVWECKKNIPEDILNNDSNTDIDIYAVKQTSKKNVTSHLKEDI